MGNMTALVGEKLGVFARTGQLSLKGSEGPVEVQAQNGNMRLFAEKKADPELGERHHVCRKETHYINRRRELPAAGSRKIEYGTTATYLRRVKKTMAAGPPQCRLKQ